MFIANPDSFLIPSFRISPFRTEHIALNLALPEDDYAIDYFNERFGEGHWQFTYNGREAIRMALEKYELDKNDLVTIVTTSENFYISSCVTSEIEMVCRWNREILPETKVIFVNHEFGYPYPQMDRLRQTGLPVIEDCCTTFFTQDDNGNIGKYGDYSVYSFPKFFPIQIGGLVVSNKAKQTDKSRQLAHDETKYIQKVLSYHLRNQAQLLRKRTENFDYALAAFSKLGFTERFHKDGRTVPSVLLLNNNAIIKDLGSLKVYLAQNGVQSSVFYGEDSFFIPTNQNLQYAEIDYFTYLIFTYIKQQEQNG
jgi:hypothetical protein